MLETQAMKEAFWCKFAEIYGEEAFSDKALFNEFYEKEFQGARNFCGYDQKQQKQ